MEIIKKKINLEEFRSRIPGKIPTMDNPNQNNSCGNIPTTLEIGGNMFRYGTIMNYYYKVLNILYSVAFKECDMSGGKWIDVTRDWREVLTGQAILVDEIKLYDNVQDRCVVGVITSSDYELIYDIIPEIFGSHLDGITYFNTINNIIGRLIVDINIDGMYVPYMIYLNEIPTLLNHMEELKSDANKNCCEKYLYEEHGGDAFYDFLTRHMNDKVNTVATGKTELVIPVLLTTDIKNLGQFSIYEGDETPEDIEVKHKILTGVSGESRLRTLRKRKRSYDDEGNELPFIVETIKENNGQTRLTSANPYQVGFAKNVQIINGKCYGDMIVSMVEDESDIVITYVIGGRLKKLGDSFDLDEISPYLISDDDINSGNWDGEGVWYQERYPYYKDLEWECIFENSKIKFKYEYIDFESVMTTYSFEGIDFPREKYILCEDIRYKSDSYLNNVENKYIFRDDTSLNIDYSMREKYDVVIDRGYASAYERHLVLSEVKTFQDLELLRNNMFNI